MPGATAAAHSPDADLSRQAVNAHPDSDELQHAHPDSGQLRREDLEAVLENLAEAITVVDASGRTVFANRAALDLLGLESQQELTQARPGEIMSRFLVLDETGAELSLASMPSRRLIEADLDLAVRLGRRAGTAVESARLYTERTRIARTLQQALMAYSPPDIPGAIDRRSSAAGRVLPRPQAGYCLGRGPALFGRVPTL
jgi:PAS domain-containing protein